MFVLGHELGLRLFIQPESTHSLWNDCRNSVRRAGLQHTLLLSGVLSNTAHGPYSGGQNAWTLKEAAESLSRMSETAFTELLEQMMEDRASSVAPEDESEGLLLPEHPSDIPNLAAVNNLPPFVLASVAQSFVISSCGTFSINLSTIVLQSINLSPAAGEIINNSNYNY